MDTMQNPLMQTHSLAATDPPVARGIEDSVPKGVNGAILIIEVDRAHREKLQSSLLACGIMAVATSSELSAMELLGHGGLFDAVFVEYATSVESEASLLHQIHHRRTDLPILAVLSEDDVALCAQARREGALHCVARSTSTDVLASELRDAVKARRVARQQGSSREGSF
jgi:DNA-binding NtrC family response regulator